MLNVLKSKTYHIPYDEEQSISHSAEQRLVSFTNKWLHITLLVNICFLILNSIKTEFPLILNIVSTSVAISFYFIASLKITKHINFYLYIFYVVWVSTYAIISSYSTGLMTYFVILIALSILLFKEQDMRNKMALLSVVMFIIVILSKPFLPELLTYTNPYRSLVHLLVSLIVVFFAIRSYATFAESESAEKDDLIQQVKNKNVELERFAYITSHDLKQPVRNICSFAGLLAKNLRKENTNEKNLEFLDIINTSSRNLEKLIEDILKYSRIDQIDDELEELDLNQIIEEQATNLSFLIESKNGKLSHENLPNIKGNNVYVRLLFQNLIENGIKYNESEKPEVSIKYRSERNSERIIIADNGLGIDKSYFDVIFQPFKRLHSNKEYEGSGLGLSICKRIVEKHNGQIELDSEPGKGTRFIIDFPKL